ncbi:unnamed protein product [Bursaphelenchus xylophilus]|uniref:(pine wood nematode) hypothetical protein n=1 Tax=Bursaphelenchus xylophilus TaxID=6326 RepID=A0A1I7RLH5_BURXY|nr:unnamed protein product [Bursaphelenchus xylophilus]CAG9082980.1 unnamed protein product [Bursaphelenchus xylophilus]
MELRPFDEFSRGENLAVVWVNSDSIKEAPNSWLKVWNSARERLCTDGAANTVMKLAIKGVAINPTVIAGDFDSITKEALQYFNEKCIIKHTPDQDFTDLSKTLTVITETTSYTRNQIKTVLILGGQSGRFDHTLSTLNSIICFQRSTKNSTSVYSVDSTNLTLIISTKSRISTDKEKITGKCGILPICQTETRVTTTGFRWNVTDEKFEYGGLISSCNEVVDGTLTIESTAPVVLTIELKSPNSFI